MSWLLRLALTTPNDESPKTTRKSESYFVSVATEDEKEDEDEP